MFLLLLKDTDILALTPEQLQYIPKILLLRQFGNQVERIWANLPAHMKSDPEVQLYRRCYTHYNRPWQRTHIDGPAPMIKDCGECLSGKDTSL